MIRTGNVNLNYNYIIVSQKPVLMLAASVAHVGGPRGPRVPPSSTLPPTTPQGGPKTPREDQKLAPRQLFESLA